MSNHLFRTIAVALLAPALAGGTVWADGPPAAGSAPSDIASDGDRPSEGAPLRVVMFYSPTCGGCPEALAAMAASEKRWGGRIRVERHQLEDRDAFVDLLRYEEHYRSEEDKNPKVFIGGQYLAGAGAVIERLDEVIAAELAEGAATFAPPPEPAGEDSEDRIGRAFRNLSIGSVIVAGLVDGVNPCAFATIIFLVSMLTYLGRSRREVAVVGIGFTASVFVTYLLLGFALLRAVKAFSVSHGIAKALACGVAGLAFVLAGWSLVDFVRYLRSRDVKKVTLGLPGWAKSGIHAVIRRGLAAPALPVLLVGSVAVGFVVALLESMCTGQVYLPIIFVIERVPALRVSAVRYLLVYNLMFIAPLGAILVIAYFGVRSERMGAFLTAHLAAFKLTLAVLFIALGALVLATV